MYGSLAIVTFVYVLVSVVIVATLSLASIDANQGHVLAEVGRALAGRVGFVAIGAAALLATASGVNATLFGDANLAFQMARNGELPEVFARDVWHGAPGSLFIAAGLTGVFVVAFPLSAGGADGEPGIPHRLRVRQRRPSPHPDQDRRTVQPARGGGGLERGPVRAAA